MEIFILNIEFIHFFLEKIAKSNARSSFLQLLQMWINLLSFLPENIAEADTSLALPRLETVQFRIFLYLVCLLQLAAAYAGLSGGLRLILLCGRGGRLLGGLKSNQPTEQLFSFFIGNYND